LQFHSFFFTREYVGFSDAYARQIQTEAALPAYGLLLLAASAWWLVTGEPFDRGTYERIGASPWSAMVGSLTSAQADVFAATVRLLGGNGGLLAGGFTVAARAVRLSIRREVGMVHAVAPSFARAAGLDDPERVWRLQSRGDCLGVGIAAVMIATLVVSYPQFSKSSQGLAP
jgi:hypothetical protein